MFDARFLVNCLIYFFGLKNCNEDRRGKFNLQKNVSNVVWCHKSHKTRVRTSSSKAILCLRMFCVCNAMLKQVKKNVKQTIISNNVIVYKINIKQVWVSKGFKL